MTSRLASNAKRHRQILTLAGALIFCSSAQATLAQDPIRVETNQVLIPTIVIDKEKYRVLGRDFSRALVEGNAQLEEDITEGVVFRDLTATDFQVFEDGKKQAIQSVTYGRSFYWNFHDNIGYHTEYLGLGGGIWSGVEWPPGMVESITPPSYLIAYSPPASREGSCHQIKVIANRRNALVIARREYCNSKNSTFLTSSGVELIKRMESDLASPNGNKIDIAATAGTFYMDNEPARVRIALDWPSNSLKRKSMRVGLLGMVFKKDGSLAARFSDVDEEADFPREYYELVGQGTWDLPTPGLPTRYETQLTLPPGDYNLRAIVTDGTKFGRAEIPLAVDPFDQKELAISAVSLCKRIQDVSAFASPARVKLLGNWRDKLPQDYTRLVSKGYEYKPTGNTRFKKDETVYTYFEVYEPLLAEQSPPEVKMQVRIVDATTGKIKTDSPPVSAIQYVKAGSSTIPIGLGVDTSMLSKGSYRLEVQVTDSAGQSTPWRTANFTVE